MTSSRGGGAQRVRVHRLDEGFPHRVGDFEQDFAVPLGLDQIPQEEPVFERQGFEDVGDVRRVQAVELVGEFLDVLLVDQAFDQIMLGHVLAMDEAFDQLVAGEQLLDLAQVNVEIVVVLEVVGFGHGAVPWAAGRRAARRLRILRGLLRRGDP